MQPRIRCHNQLWASSHGGSIFSLTNYPFRCRGVEFPAQIVDFGKRRVVLDLPRLTVGERLRSVEEAMMLLKFHQPR